MKFLMWLRFIVAILLLAVTLIVFKPVSVLWADEGAGCTCDCLVKDVVDGQPPAPAYWACEPSPGQTKCDPKCTPQME
jgi:hypothetical protein